MTSSRRELQQRLSRRDDRITVRRQDLSEPELGPRAQLRLHRGIVRDELALHELGNARMSRAESEHAQAEFGKAAHVGQVEDEVVDDEDLAERGVDEHRELALV